MTVSIRQVTAAQADAVQPLCELLQDAVHGGASVGFLAPLSIDEAGRYWQRVFEQLPGELRLWVAETEGRIIGSVQLDLCPKPNGRHRAEILKLLVHSDFRGRGVSSLLMAAAEERARAEGRTLLVLDTQARSTAASIYRHLGWLPGGQIPDYATGPDGTLHPTVYFYKRLTA
jgi:GNAT superfamily N-acetyltransferase